MLEGFRKEGKASFLIGGQWGSEGKGGAAAFVGAHLAKRNEYFDIHTTNAGSQAGHTSIHNGVKRVCFHMPTMPLIARRPYNRTIVYLNSGSIIDVDVLFKELRDYWESMLNKNEVALFIHPRAAIITQECKDEEGAKDSSTTAIASTRKGVGAALARKVMRKGKIASQEERLATWHPNVRVEALDLNARLSHGQSVMVEVPQGQSLSLNSQFYPHVTSRIVSIQQTMADAEIHPHYYHESMMVLRTFPIRVGSIEEHGMVYSSGGAYPGQNELSWKSLGLEPEITTVTKRVRRIFEPSPDQIMNSMTTTRPDRIMLNFCDYSMEMASSIRNSIEKMSFQIGTKVPEFMYGFGPTTDDIRFDLHDVKTPGG